MKDGETGNVVPVDRWESLASTVGGLLKDPDRWREMAHSARRFALNDRSYSVLAQRLSGFLDQIRAGKV